MSSDGVPVRTAQMAWQRVDGELVLLAIDDGTLMGVNALGARIWELIDDERGLDAIVASLLHEVDADEVTLRRDVSAFVADLVARGVVTMRGPA